MELGRSASPLRQPAPPAHGEGTALRRQLRAEQRRPAQPWTSQSPAWPP